DVELEPSSTRASAIPPSSDAGRAVTDSDRLAQDRVSPRGRRAPRCPRHLRRMNELPLAGLCVVDVTTSLAGPYCTEILGALGADVVKVERPDGGDDTRTWGPPFVDGTGAMFLCANASKRSVALRLSDPAGLEAVLRLADRADVFVQSLRPGLADARGLGYEALSARNPRLVYCSIGSFGRVGPLRDQPGYDPL